MKKRFIFDLDETLLHGDFSRSIEYFKSVLTEEEAKKFFLIYPRYLTEFEKEHKKYDYSTLSKFLSEKTGINITCEIIDGWVKENSSANDRLLDETKSMLEYLKDKKKSLVVLTNWFKYEQVERLKNAGILEFFDNVYTGDTSLKPNKESYLNSCGNYHVNECVMIGDSIENDVIGPNKFGIDSIYYNPENKEYDKSKILSINSFDRIKEMF